MKRARLMHAIGAAAVLASLSFATGCSDANAARVALRPSEAASALPANWDSIFVGAEIPIRYAPGERPIQRIPRVFLIQATRLAIPDVRASRVIVVDTTGNRTRDIPFPPFADAVDVPSALVVDDSLTLHLYLPSKRNIYSYRLGSMAPASVTPVEGLLADFLPRRDGGFYVYYPASAEGVVRLIDKDGRTVRNELPFEDASLRAFHGRTQNGGIAQMADGRVVALSPAEYAVHLFDPALQHGQSWAGDTASVSSFAPRPFPSGLSPQDISKAHTTWWNSFRHADRPFAVTDSLLLVSHYASAGLYKSQYAVSLISTTGRVRAENVAVPLNGRVVAAKDRTVIVVVPPTLVPGTDSLTALRLLRYTLRPR